MENYINKNQPEASAPEEKSFIGVIFHSFFIIPFIIAVFMLLLFWGVRALTTEQKTAFDYLEDVKTGGLTKRWQSAFELSKLLASPQLKPSSEKFYSELKKTFLNSSHDDSRVQQYLALAMGKTENVIFAETLLSALKSANPDAAASIIYALGMLKETKDSPVAIYPFLENPDPQIRLASVIALGNIGQSESVPYIRKALFDAEPNIKWDAAVALAKLQDESGKEVLLNLLDRQYLSGFPQVDANEQIQIMIVAMRASALLKDAQLQNALVDLAKNDPNIDVRKTALELTRSE
ncbi:MAG: HEAT repeat domain-containing protein [Candidatus Omnitrophota bacterium]